MKLRVYLDTSVISAFYDQRVPERMAETRDFWDRLGSFEVTVSELVRQEVEQTAEANRRARMLGLLAGLRVEAVTTEMEDLAAKYVGAGLVSPTMFSDALHLAAAMVLRQDVLVSWNFRHLVNRRMRASVAQVNAALGLSAIEILAPSEL